MTRRRADGLDAWLDAARRAGPADLRVHVHGLAVLLRAAARERGIDLSRATLVHSGGWKKLAEQSASPTRSSRPARATPSGSSACTTSTAWSSRSAASSSSAPPASSTRRTSPTSSSATRERGSRRRIGEPGVVEVLSLLPRSYPGHALLDRGPRVVHGVDDCPCGRMGSRFTCPGRVPKAEIRGCSDTHAPSRLTGRRRRQVGARRTRPGRSTTFVALVRRERSPARALRRRGASRSAPRSRASCSPSRRRRDLAAARLRLATGCAPPRSARMRESFAGRRRRAASCVPRGRVLHVTPAQRRHDVRLQLAARAAGRERRTSCACRAATTDSAAASAATSSRRCSIAASSRDSAAAKPPRSHRRTTTRVRDALSSIADVRVVWGGDATVDALPRVPAAAPRPRRDLPEPPLARASSTPTPSGRADDDELAALGGRFFNDAYWFDQAACSSPRLMIWQSCPAMTPRTPGAGSTRPSLDAVRRRSRRSRPGSPSTKHGLRLPSSVGRRLACTSRRRRTRSTWIELPELAAYDRAHCGGGLFFEFVDERPGRRAQHAGRAEDQTAACYGLEPTRCATLAAGLNGRGIDRFVPVGRALEFSATWDGYDLLGEFVKRVVIDV